MSYTMTYDASHKVGHVGSHATAFVRHIARDADQAAGFAFTHTNPNVDASRTHLNETRVNDGKGGFRPLASVDGRPPSEELESYLARRIATVKGKLRKDAVVMRPLILQLDPKWFEEHDPLWRQNGLSDEAIRYSLASLEWACEEFGQENVVGYSFHNDEHSPQLQVLFTPVTQDGRLSQKDFFKGPSDLKRQRKVLLDRMQSAGYDVQYATTERSKEHLSSAEYQRAADRARELEERAVEHQRVLDEYDVDQDERDIELRQRQADLDAQLAELPSLRSRAIDEGLQEGRQEALRAAEPRIAAEVQQRLTPARQRLAEREKELDERADLIRRLSAATTHERVPLAMDAWLDEPLPSGKTLRPMWQHYSKRLRDDPAQAKQTLDAARAAKAARQARVAKMLADGSPHAPSAGDRGDVDRQR